MDTPDNRRSETGVTAASSAAAPSQATPTSHSEDGHHSENSAESARKQPSRRRGILLIGAGVGSVVVLVYFLVPWVYLTLNTVSTDDAYVNGHVTYVAARVPGQVKKVFVDDNMRVKEGDVLVTLDDEPYRVQLKIKQAAVETAKSDLYAAEAQARGLVAQSRSNRYKLEHSIENVNNEISNLRAAVTTIESKKATLQLAKENLKRGEELAPKGTISKEEFDQRKEAFKVAQAALDQTLQQVYAIRARLGLPTQPQGKPLDDVPPDLDQNFSSVRQALAELIQSAAQLGYSPPTWNPTPKEAIGAFYKQDPEENLDRIYAKLIPNSPAVKQADAKLLKAKRDLEDAELNLRYCKVVSEIDGVVTRRNVNPGNNVTAGQSLMAVPSPRSGSTPTSRKRSWRICASASASRSRSICTAAARNTKAELPASRWGRGRRSLFCRRKTRRATSSRSCSVCRCASS